MKLKGQSKKFLGETSKATTSTTNNARKRSVSSIVFWSLYAIAQCFIVKLYHHAALTKHNSSAARDDASLQEELALLTGLQNFAGKDYGSNHNNIRNKNGKAADGTFNGYPIYKLPPPPPPKQEQVSNGNNNNNNTNHIPNPEELYSQFHCAGETWHDKEYHQRSKTNHEQSWMYRSCRFQVFCYDTYTQEYAIYLDSNRHASSHKDHGYHNDTRPHRSEHIQKILDQQKATLKAEVHEIANPQHPRKSHSVFKHITFMDDTSTVYRNHSIVVNGGGAIPIGDTERGKHYGVSIGSVNAKWGLVDIQNLKWWPEVRWGPVPQNNDGDYEVYTLPSSVVLIPFHSLSASNPGHLVWDDFLPMYTLLEMFGFLNPRNISNLEENGVGNDSNNKFDLLPIRYVLPHEPVAERGLWASCDWTNEKRDDCQKMLTKFGILMGTRRSFLKYQNTKTDNPEGLSAAKLPKIDITTNRAVEMDVFGEEANNPKQKLNCAKNGGKACKNRALQQNGKKKLICAKNALVGFGAISDHKPHLGHGWERWDYETSYNSGRGRQLYDFRNYMIHNLFEGMPKEAAVEKRSTKASSNGKQKRADHSTESLRGKIIDKGVGVGAGETMGSRMKNINNFKNPTSSVLLQEEYLETYPLSSITDMGPEEPLVVLFSGYSSQRRGGSMESETQMLVDAIEKAGGSFRFLYGRDPTPQDVGKDVEIVVENHVFARYSIEEQIQMASRSAAFVSYCGGGAITGSFLPRGASLQLYYGEDSGIEHNKKTGLPARLDWDFFNNCAYLHVTWLPFFASLNSLAILKAKNINIKEQIGDDYESQAEVNVDVMRNQLQRIHRTRVQHFEGQQRDSKRSS